MTSCVCEMSVSILCYILCILYILCHFLTPLAGPGSCKMGPVRFLAGWP